MIKLMQVLLVIAFVSSSALASATPIMIQIDTTAIAGTSARLAFDFLDGGLPSNSVTVTGFVTNGTLGFSSAAGGVTGALPGTVVLTDSSFFNELLTGITLGTRLSFTFNATANAGVTPDEFSVFLLNTAGTASLFPTNDPTGADALLAFEITTGPGVLTLFSAPGGQAATTVVPEPRSLILSGLGLGILTTQRRRFRFGCAPGQ